MSRRSKLQQEVQDALHRLTAIKECDAQEAIDRLEEVIADIRGMIDGLRDDLKNEARK